MSRLFAPSYYTEADLADEGFRCMGRNVRIARTCTLVGAENIALGDNVRIDGYCTLVAAGPGCIEIGSYVHIGGYCALLGAEGIRMHDYSTLSWGVKVFTRSDDFSGQFMTNPTVPLACTRPTRAPVEFGRHVVVGAGCVVLPGVTVGTGSAVGALSFVPRPLDAWGIFAGVPARRIKARRRDVLSMEQTVTEARLRADPPEH